MPTFVLMTKLAAEKLNDAEGRRAAGKQWLGRVKETCPEVRWIAHYSLLGPYDFMDIYEAPDTETAHKVSLLSRTKGALTAESWQAMPYEEYLKVLSDVAG